MKNILIYIFSGCVEDKWKLCDKFTTESNIYYGRFWLF